MPQFDAGKLTSRTFVRFVEYHTSLDSTNALATELWEELGRRSPALVLADEQTAGRGRGHNAWWSSTGALTFSVILDADTWGPPPDHQPLLALAAGLAVRNAIAKHLARHSVLIKWPNDVLVDDRKLCGILCEHHQTTAGGAFIVGIGINVNNSLSGAPDDVRLRATSLYDLTGDSHDLTDVLIAVLNELERVCLQLRKSPEAIVRQVATFDRLRGTQVTIDTPGQTVTGRCTGIAADGALLVDSAGGPRTVRAGTVRSFE